MSSNPDGYVSPIDRLPATGIALVAMGEECPDCHQIMPVTRWQDGLEGVVGAELPSGHRCTDKDGRKVVRVTAYGGVSCVTRYSDNVAAGRIHTVGRL